ERDWSLVLLMVERRRSSYCLFCLLRVKALYIDRCREKPRFLEILVVVLLYCNTMLAQNHIIGDTDFMCLLQHSVSFPLTELKKTQLILLVAILIHTDLKSIFWECIDRSKWEVICTYLPGQTVTSTKLDINTY
ncbi:hypothetical protein ALC53_01602, partial [Atta colombica]